MVVLFYVAGNVVQGAAVVWEAIYWAKTGGWPSTRRMTQGDAKAYSEPFRALIQAKLDRIAGTETATLPVPDRFGLASSELRRQGQDTRAESFNATYGLSRGLLTAAAIVLIVMLVCAAAHHDAHRNLIAAAVIAGSAIPVYNRFRRFGFYFADQIWRALAALPR